MTATIRSEVFLLIACGGYVTLVWYRIGVAWAGAWVAVLALSFLSGMWSESRRRS